MFDIEDFQEEIYPYLIEKVGSDFISIDLKNKVVKFFENQYGRRGKMIMQLYPKSDKLHLCRENEWLKEDGLLHIANHYDIPELKEMLGQDNSLDRFSGSEPEYIIVSANTVKELEVIVLQKIREDFILNGAPFTSNSIPEIFYQSLFK